MCCEVFKFWVNSFDGLWNKEWQDPKLGDAHGTQDNPRTPKSQSLGMPRKASPLSSTSIGNLLGAIFLFTTWYVFCLERLVWFEYLFVSLPQSSLLYTPFERAIYELEFVRILYVLHLYLLSLIVFALVLHLDLLEHGGVFLKKLLISHASLKLIWES